MAAEPIGDLARIAGGDAPADLGKARRDRGVLKRRPEQGKLVERRVGSWALVARDALCAALRCGNLAGVGIAHGYATLGTIGFEGRSDYSAIGTVVNFAARLCSEAGDGHILVDGKVRAALGNVATLERAGDLALKGLHRVVPAFYLHNIS
jgi:class 3 adenylate cyclase